MTMVATLEIDEIPVTRTRRGNTRPKVKRPVTLFGSLRNPFAISDMIDRDFDDDWLVLTLAETVEREGCL
jgi:hypothetical protein